MAPRGEKGRREGSRASASMRGRSAHPSGHARGESHSKYRLNTSRKAEEKEKEREKSQPDLRPCTGWLGGKREKKSACKEKRHSATQSIQRGREAKLRPLPGARIRRENLAQRGGMSLPEGETLFLLLMAVLDGGGGEEKTRLRWRKKKRVFGSRRNALSLLDERNLQQTVQEGR